MLRLILSALAVALVATVALSADEKKDSGPVRQIATEKADKIETKGGSATKPTKVTTAEELEMRVPDEATRKRLAQQVDFKSHTLLVFAWQGSGGDKIEYVILESKPEQVEFMVKPGRTKDLRPHVKLFVLPNDVKWAVK